MHQYITLILSVSIYLFVIGITIWALTAPYMEANILGGLNLEVYLTKECISDQCEEYKDDPNRKIFMQNGQALMALYIIFLITAALCMMLYLAKMKTLCNYAGLLTLGMALATMITLIIIVKTTTIGIINSFEFSSASILIIISCCLMIIKQIMANGIIRSLIKH